MVETACEYCQKSFSNREHLARHIRTHTGQQPFSCTLCGRAFARRDSLQRHERRQKVGGDGIRRCPANTSAAPVPVASTSYLPPSQMQQQPAPSTSYLPPSMPVNGHSNNANPIYMLSEAADQYTQAPAPSSMPQWQQQPFVPMSSTSHLPDYSPWLNGSSLSGQTPRPDNSQLDFNLWLNPANFDAAYHEVNSLPDSASTAGYPPLFDFSTPNDFSFSPSTVSPAYSLDKILSPNPNILPLSEQSCQAMRNAVEIEARSSSSVHETEASAVDMQALRENLELADQAQHQPNDFLNVLGGSFDFVDSCVAAYFQHFHPLFPILHAPTFSRPDCPPVLLLSVVAIGAIFLKTRVAAVRGQSIYRRLNKVLLNTWDVKMARNSREAVVITQTGLLLQTFGYMSDSATDRLTSITFHSTTSLWLWQNRISSSALSSGDALYNLEEKLEKLDEADLNRVWAVWLRAEGERRAIAGIMIQEGALQNKSSNPYLVTDCNTEKEMCADALWSASTAESWRKLYLDKTTHTKPSDFRSYLKICLGAIHLRLLRAIPDSHPKTSLKLTLQRTMYGYLASERQSNAGERRDSNIPSLVHFLLLESRLDSVLLQSVVGYYGSALATQSAHFFKTWVLSQDGRTALLEAGSILSISSKRFVHDRSGLHMSRSIYYAAVVIFVYVALVPPSPTAAMLDISGRTDYLASDPMDPYTGFLEGWQDYRPYLPNFFDGQDQRGDLVRLLTTSADVLSQYGPWGISALYQKILTALAEIVQP